MADRYIEFQEKVKFILDKSNAKKDVQEFAEEVQGAFENVKVGIDAKSLYQLGKMFNEKLDELGKKPIVFNDIEINDKALKEITTRFMNAIGDGIRAGVKIGVDDALAEIARLEKLKKPKIDRQRELENKRTGFTSLQNIRGDKESVHPHPLAKEKDIISQAKKVYDQFQGAKDALAQASYGTDAEYDKALDKMYDAIENMYRMRQTIKNNVPTFAKNEKMVYDAIRSIKGDVAEIFDEEIELFQSFRFEDLNKLVDTTLKDLDTSLKEYFSIRSNDYGKEIRTIQTELDDIDNKINEIKNSNPEIINQEAVNKALKSLEEVEAAYDRIRNKTKKKDVNKNKLAAIESTIAYDPAAANNKTILGTLSKGLNAARHSGAGWEEEYQWIVKFVKQYKWLQENDKLSEHLQKQYGSLFNELVGMAENAETSLRTLVDRAEGKIKPENVGDNAEKLRIEEEKKLAAENQAKAAAELASAAEREGETKKETLKIEEKRLAIMKELSKYGTLKDAMSAGGKKIDFDGETVHFGSMVSDYMDEALGQSFSREGYEKLWKEARVEFGPKFEPFELTKEDAIEVIREKVPDNILDGWFRGGDSSYKAKLEQLAMSDDDIRNAALNIMWSNFKEFSGKDIGFADFLQSEISMYRGKNSENYVDGDETIALTFDRKVAESFGKYVLETLVKPIETIGAYQTTGESEALVYRDKLEDKPEYQRWHDDMAGKTTVVESAEEQERIRKETESKALAEQKAREEAEARVRAEQEAAEAAEKERKSTEETLKTEEERQKLLLYRIGKTEFKPDRFRNTDMMGNSIEARKGGFGGYGDGLFAVVKNSMLDIIKSDISPDDPESYFEFDASKYNLYWNKTVEQAEAVSDFSNDLQKFILAAGDFRGFDDDVEGIDEKTLFAQATQVFGQINMSQEQFAEWISSMKKLVVDNGLNSEGVFEKADESFLNSRNFFSRFMMSQGYQGLINDTGDYEIDGMYQGSVIYEPDFKEITEYIQSNETAFKKIRDFLLYVTGSKEKVNDIIAYLNESPYNKLHPIEAFDTEIDAANSVSEETVEHQKNTKAIQEETAAQEELNQKKKEAADIPVPSEDDIKGGKASWRGVPIQYDSSLSGEARNLTDFMKVGPKFFGMDEEAQKSILDHEVAHNIADRIMDQATDEWEKVADIFAPKKLLPEGANPPFYTEEDDEGNRWYREGLYGDLGATALSETLTHALTEYFSNPDAFKKRDEGAFNYLDEYLNKSGDTLDNAAVDAVREEIAAQEQLNDAKKEEQQIEQQTDTVVADNQKKIESYEELKQALQEYYDISSKIKRIEWTEKDNKWLGIESVRFPDGAMDEPEKYFKQQWKRVSLIRKSIKDGADSYIDPELKTAVRIQENTLEKEMQELEAYATQFTLNVEGFSDAQKKFVNEINQKYDKWIQQNEIRYAELDKYNKPYEDRAHEIDSLIGKQLKDPNDMKSYSTFMRALSNVKQYGVTEQSLKIISNLIGVEVPQAAETAKQAVDGLNTSLEKQQQIEHADSSQAQVTETKAETTAIEQQNEELKENLSLKQMVENASQRGIPGQSVADAAGITGTGDVGVGANMQELQNILSAITYNVKIINDDTDKTANKIALDDSSLEATLNRVFANILNPATEQNDGNVKEPWALESTLQTVKGVLDTIQTNTSKIGSIQSSTAVAPTPQYDVNDVGNTLKFIEKSLNDIKSKIGKASTASSKDKPASVTDKPSTQNSSKPRNIKPAKTDSRVKELQDMYEQRGKLMAQYSFNHSDEAAAEINQLNQTIKLRMKELYIEEARRSVLKKLLMERQEESKKSEKSLILARQAAQAARDEKAARAQAARDEKANLKARLKRSKEENRFGASTTALNSGNKTLESLWKIDEKDKPLEQKSVQDLMAALKELNTVRQRVNENLRKGIEISEVDSAELAEKTKQVAMHTEAVKQLVKNYDDLSGPNAKETGHIFGGGDLEANLKNVAMEITNGRAKIGDFDAATGRLKYTVKTGAYEFEEYEIAVREAGGAIVSLQKGTKRTETFLEGFKRKLSEITRYFSASSLIFKFFNEFRKGIQYIREIDSALVELRKVTDETEETYNKFLDTAAKTASRLGSTISAVTEATATFAKLGYTMEMAAEMAEAAIVYKNVGDNIASTEDAADSIISTLKGFGLEASEAMRIVDRFNEVGNKFAITSQGLGEALRLSASALNEGGNTLDESIGIITAANEVVNDPSSVGTALKTLTLRLRGSKTELEEMGEDVSDMATTTSQLQAKLLALTGGQVDIMLDEHTFKSSTQILREMAAAWESMTDIQQASALELMGGKRQANVLSALISNFDTAEEAIEASANSAGSALRENEVHLDSIQGKIEQFTAAMQTMWKNALDSDAIKFFISIATELIKLVDSVGLLGTALGGIFVYLTAFKKQTPLALLKQIWGVITNISVSIKANGFGRWIKSILGVAPALKTVTAEIVANTIATQTNDAAKTKQMMTDMGLIGVTGTLSAAQRQQARDVILNAMATGQLTMVQGNAMLAMLGYSAATVAADGSLNALDATTKSFMATNPIGWILAIVSVIATVITLLSQIPSKIERLKEKLSNLKSELSDIKSDIDSVNSELQTTQSRMAELLALDSLSFTEKEELDNLRKQNDELQRRLDLLEHEKKLAQKETANAFVQTMEESVNNSTYNTGGKRDFWSRLADALDTEHKNTIWTADEYVDYLMENYEQATKVESGEIDGIIGQKSSTFYTEKIQALLKEWVTAADGLEYGIDEETDEWLDYVYNLQDKWAITSGGNNAKTNAINRIFNKNENSDISESIDGYVEALKKGDVSAKASIENIIKNNKDLVEDIEASGLSIDDAINYFTQFASDANFSTVEGKMAETTEAANRLSKALSGNFDSSSFKDIETVKQLLTDKGWVDADGELLSTAIAEYFGGADGGVSEATRKEIERLVKQIYDGKLTVEDALKEFELFSVQSTLDIYIGEVQTNFKDVFVDLEEADGLINTFEELGEAIGSAAGALDSFNQAEAEMAYSGQVSIETALQLMEYTDDYGSVLTVVDGKLQLAEGAEEALIETRLASIKTSAEAALQDAQLASEKAWLAVEEYKSAMQTEASTTVIASAWDQVLAKAAGFAAGIKSLFTSESWSEAYNNAYNQAMSKVAEKRLETKYTDDGLQALVDAAEESDNKLAVAKSNNEVAQNLTVDNLKGVYDSEEASGGTKTKKEAEDKTVEDGWEKLISEYENKLALITNERDLIQAEIDKMEAQGGQASKEMYDDLIRSQLEEKKLLEEKKKALEDYLAEHGDSIDPETWTEYNNAINETAVAIKECETNIIDFAKALHDIDMHYFNQAIDEISRLGEEIEFVMSLFEDEDMFDEDGNWTDAGITKINLLKDLITTYAATANMWKDRMSDLDAMEIGENGLYKFDEDTKNAIAEDFKSMLDSGQIDQDTYDTLMAQLEEAWANGGLSKEIWTEWRNEAEDGWCGAVSAGQDAQDELLAMNDDRIDAIEEGIQKEIEAYEDYIDVLKESLDAERDLYDFKKNVQKQSKDIASLERRIAALSGSTNAADVAERRKLEAELLEAKEGLNDTYYDHSRDAQSNALDDEAEAFSKAKEKYIETLREWSKDGSAVINDMFLNGIFNADVANEFLLGIEEKYEIPLSDKLKAPWATAAETATGLKESVGVPVDNTVTMISDSIIQKLGTDDENNPWNKAVAMADKYADFLTSSEFSIDNKDMTTFEGQINSIVSGWNRVKKAADDAYTAQTRKTEVGGNPNAGNTPTSDKDQGGGGDTGGGSTSSPAITALQKIINQFFGGALKEDGKIGPLTKLAIKVMQGIIGVKKTGEYDKITYEALKKWLNARPVGSWFREKGITIPAPMYAKGTMGTKQSGFAITDESWIGEEITLAAGKNGQLQYLKKGSAVMPADISANLVEWGKLNPNMLKVGGGANLNMIRNAINKPEINLDIAEFLHVDRVDKDTMPELEKFVDKKMNDLVRQLNYSIKKFK